MKAIILILLTPAILWGQVLVSEVLYNEPEGRVRLEWIEIYNGSLGDLNLAPFRVVAGGDTLAFESSASLPSQSFAILSRHLISFDNGDSFERFWGDSTDFWGDGDDENYPAFQFSFSLPNPAGAVYVIDTISNIIDSCSWRLSGPDGVSWERNDVNSGAQQWHECTASLGATPGLPNSPIAVDYSGQLNITIVPRIIYHSAATVFNIHYETPTGCRLDIDIYSDTGRKIIAVAENLDSGPGEISWNGRRSSGQALEPGIYLFNFNLNGRQTQSAQIPVVIAP